MSQPEPRRNCPCGYIPVSAPVTPPSTTRSESIAELELFTLRRAVVRTRHFTGEKAYPHRGAIWLSKSAAERIIARHVSVFGAVPTPGSLFGQPFKVYADGDAWRWDHGHVAQARAHAELRNLWRRPAARIVRAVNRLLSRGTR